jgi:hypothetical protein
MGENEPQKTNGEYVWLIQEAEAWAQERKDYKARLEAVEREQSAVMKRRDSIDIGTAGKGGNFKHYFDPGAPVEENDHLLAEAARNHVNAGGILPENFSKKIVAKMLLLEQSAEHQEVAKEAPASNATSSAQSPKEQPKPTESEKTEAQGKITNVPKGMAYDKDKPGWNFCPLCFSTNINQVRVSDGKKYQACFEDRVFLNAGSPTPVPFPDRQGGKA